MGNRCISTAKYGLFVLLFLLPVFVSLWGFAWTQTSKSVAIEGQTTPDIHLYHINCSYMITLEKSQQRYVWCLYYLEYVFINKYVYGYIYI
jgi:hypothetical protein